MSLSTSDETFERFIRDNGDTDYTSSNRLSSPRNSGRTGESAPNLAWHFVTGRPRRDCISFFKATTWTPFFDAMYCMEEDGPSKPDPFPSQTRLRTTLVEPSHSLFWTGDTIWWYSSGCIGGLSVRRNNVRCRGRFVKPRERRTRRRHSVHG
jgi:hypothetical protein